jgi:ribosomal protein L16 Arg81 hydroxylase
MVACRFLETLTLGSLVAPVTEEEFRARYWEQKPLMVHRGEPGFYGDLFTLQDFDAAVTRATSHVKLTNEAARKTVPYRGPEPPGLEAVLDDMRDGGTLVLDQLHLQEPKLGLLCRLLGQELGHLFKTELFLTPPHGKSSVPHWDNVDVFVLQVLGSKHWQIEQERRVFPVRPDSMDDDDVRAFRAGVTSVTVNQGDLIYIPRGFMHVAECASEASLHISLKLVPVVMEELLHAIIKAAAQRDETLRVALPLGFMQGGGERLVKHAMAALRDVADETFLSAVVDQFRDELVKTFPLDKSGQVVDFFQPTPLTAGDIVGPRRGVVYRLHVGDESVRLAVGTRSIVFPGFFREALAFALDTPAYAIRDVAGELEDEERIVFIERLMREGLVVRKP